MFSTGGSTLSVDKKGLWKQWLVVSWGSASVRGMKQVVHIGFGGRFAAHRDARPLRQAAHQPPSTT